MAVFLIIRKYDKLKKLDSEEYKSKFGPLQEGLRTRGWIASRWNLLILLRWTLTTFILITLRDYSGFQLISLLPLSVLFQCLILVGRPTNQFDDNLITFLNELFVSFYLYLLILLTDFMGENTLRDSLGNALVGLVCLGVVVNLLKLLISVTLDLRARCRVKRLREEQERRAEERRRERERVERVRQILERGQ